MKLRSNLLIFIFQLIFIHSVRAQKNILVRGKVFDTQNNSLASVGISLFGQSTKDTLILAFTHSGPEGDFSIQIEEDTSYIYQLSVHSIGYESYLHTFDRKIPSSNLLEIRLTEAENTLDSVIVRAKKWPVEIKEDTMTFNTSSFKNGSEKNLEELLKKIPNLRVSENGDIFANGKQIEKIIIEGEDIFSSNYKLISRNMNPTYIDKVEIIDNYNENPLLKGIEKTGKVVLNLSVSEKLKNQVFGDVSIAGGFINKGEVTSNIFNLNKRFILGFVSNMNNLGQDPLPDAQYYLSKKNNTENYFINLNLGQANPSITSDIPKVPYISNGRTIFNNVILLGNSATYKISKKAKITSNFIFLKDRQEFLESNSLNFFLADSINITDKTKSNSKPNFIQGEIKLDFKPLKNLFLEAGAGGSALNSMLQQSTISTNFFFNDTLSYNSVVKNKLKNGFLNLTYLINKGIAFEFKFIASQSDVPQILTSQSRRYLGVANNSENLSNIFTQEIEHLSNGVNFYAILKAKKSPKFAYKYRLSYHVGNEYFKINSVLNGKLQYNEKESKIGKKVLILGSDFTYEYQKWRLILGGDIVLPQVYSNIKVSTIKPIFNPIIGIGKRFDVSQKIVFLVTQSLSLPTMLDVLDVNILANFKNFQQGNGVYESQFSRIATLNYELNNISSLYFLNFNITGSKNMNNFANDIQTNGILLQSKKFFLKTPIYNLTSDFSFNKAFQAISSQVRFNLGGNIGDNYVFFNSLDPIYSRKSLLNTEFGFLYNKFSKITFETGYRMTYGEVAYPKMLTQANIKFNQSNPFFIIRYKPNERIYLKIINDLFQWNQLDYKTDNLLMCDLSLKSESKSQKWSTEFSIINGLNNHNLVSNSIQFNYSSQNIYRIQPRSYLFTLKYKL